MNAGRRANNAARSRMRSPALAAVTIFILAAFVGPPPSESRQLRVQSTGQTVYVPVWPHVFHGPRISRLKLAATLQVHNVDPDEPIELLSVDYFDFNGSKLRSFLGSDAPLRLKPFAARSYHLKEEEFGGSVGANFLVRWRSAEPVNAPIIDAVMIGVEHGQGISFVSHGVAISEP